ncbi:MAG: Ig-like domain-containing protein [Proteobacteria bacterium]|nr:Ig-like domain-containing protein [Pseudomonadota bacterium]
MSSIPQRFPRRSRSKSLPQTLTSSGATQQFTAVDQLGRPRTDVSWSVDNTSIATITTDSSPTLTGVAAGTVNLTASLGSISVSVQVNILAGTSLPIGTVLWSAPPVAGFTTQRIIQAVPTSNGTPDLYSIDIDNNGNYLVTGFSASGQQLWQTSLSNNLQLGIDANNGQVMGDSTGGLILHGNGITTLNLDGQSGAIAWQRNDLPGWVPFGLAAGEQHNAVGQDGSMFVPVNNAAQSNLLKLDPQAGTSSAAYTAPYGKGFYVTGTCSGPNTTGGVIARPFYYPGSVSSPIVDANGNAVFTASYEIDTPPTTSFCGPDGGPESYSGGSQQINNFLVSVAPNGTATTTTLPISSAVKDLHVLAPDGNGGALVSWWTIDSNNVPSSFMLSTTTGTPYATPLNAVNPQLVLGENNTAFITNGLSVASLTAQRTGDTKHPLTTRFHLSRR